MRTLASVLIALLLTTRLPAQSLPPDSLFPRLTGRWVLRGTIARQQTIHDVTFEWLLGASTCKMHEVSRERSATGSPAYEAVVLFGRDPQTGAYACLWLDNTDANAFDAAGIGRGSVAGDSIPFLSATARREQLHTTFVYGPERPIPGSGTWTMTAPESGAHLLE